MAAALIEVGVHAGALELRWAGDAPGAGAHVDFAAFRPTGLAQHPLVRAVGRGSGAVIDATAGLGADAWLLAASGRRVIALERCEPVRRVLEDGLARARADPTLRPVADRIAVVAGDAILRIGEVLRASALAGEAAAAVYLDPMYPEAARGSALAPKDIRLVRAAAGDDLDAEALLAAACAAVRDPAVPSPLRVIVRRPHAAPPMAPPLIGGIRAPLNARFESKLVRYDLHLAARASA